MTLLEFEYQTHWKDGAWCPLKAKISLNLLDHDHLSHEIMRNRSFYEKDLLEYLRMHGPSGGAYIDVGANIGNHSVYFGKFMADYVVGVEPNLSLEQVYRSNMEHNGIKHYRLIAMAVGARTGRRRLLVTGDASGNVGAARVDASREHGSDSAMTSMVEITTLDRIVDELGGELRDRPVTLLKIDIEGMELEALRGARRLLSRYQPHLVVELATPEQRAAVESFLADFGYKNVGQFCATPTFHFINPDIHALRADPRLPVVDAEVQRLSLTVREIQGVVPVGASFIVADEEQIRGEFANGARHALPFLERHGQYWGPPPDDETAIRELERLREAGATCMVFAWSAFWWLGYYVGLRDYLRRTYPCILKNDRLVVFDLRA